MLKLSFRFSKGIKTRPLLCRHPFCSVENHFLGRQQIYAVPAWSRAQVEILVLPPWYTLPDNCTWMSITDLENLQYFIFVKIFASAQQNHSMLLRPWILFSF